MPGISTIGTSQSPTNWHARKTAEAIRETNRQATSAEKADAPSGLGGDAHRVDQLSAKKSPIARYQRNIETTIRDVNTMAKATEDVLNLVEQTKLDLSRTLNGANGDNVTEGADAKANANRRLEALESILNKTSIDGKYLFGGTVTDRKPIGTIPDYTDPMVADDSYYAGNISITSIHASASEEIIYDINAGNPAFEKAIRTLKSAANGDFQNANSLVDETMDDVRKVNEQLLGVENSARTMLNDKKREITVLEFDLASLTHLSEADQGEAFSTLMQLYTHQNAANLARMQEQRATQQMIQAFQ